MDGFDFDSSKLAGEDREDITRITTNFKKEKTHTNGWPPHGHCDSGCAMGR